LHQSCACAGSQIGAEVGAEAMRFSLVSALLATGVALLPVQAGAQTLTPPLVKEQPAAEWPEGKADLHDVLVPVVLEVTADGAVQSVVVEASVSPEFDARAIENARLWRFEPALRDGIPVAAKIRAVVRFVTPSPIPNIPQDPKPEVPALPPNAPAAAAPAVASRDAAVVRSPVNEPLAEVHVIGQRGSKRPSSASEFSIRPGQLRDVPRRSAQQLLTLAPGFALSNHGGALHPTAVFLRGFDAGEGQDIEFTLDGVPMNEVSNSHGHGYADLHPIIPELVSELRVVEGPFDVQQGDFAVAGSVAFDLGLEERGVHAKAQYGSFDTQRLTLLWGPEGESQKTYVGAQVEQSSGFGPNRAHRAARLMAGYQHRWNDGASLQVSATSYVGTFDSAGVIRRDDFEARRLTLCPADQDAQFFCYYDANQGGGVSRHGLSAAFVKRSARAVQRLQIFGTLRQLRLRENYTGFVTDFQATGDAQRGDGVEQLYNATTVGGRGSYELSDEWRGLRQELELGYLLRYDDGTSAQRRLRRLGGEPYKEDFDNRLRITNLATYVAARTRPWAPLVLRAGVRLDTFAFAVADRTRPTLDRQGIRLGTDYAEAFGFAVQPRLSAEGMLGGGVSLLSSYGVGTRSSDAQALSDGEFAPFARVQALDLGVIVRRDAPAVAKFEARAVGFFTHVDRDLLFEETLGRNVLVGGSTRLGGLVAGRFTHPLGVDAAANVTYAEAFVQPAGAGVFEVGSTRLPYIPRWVVRFDASLRLPLQLGAQHFQWTAALGTTYVGPRPLPLNKQGDQVLTTDIALKLRYRSIEVGFDVTNLFDARYHEAELHYASNFVGPEAPASQLAEEHFAAGAPRSLMASLAVHFGASPPAE
jgi:TonB family protein